MPLYGYARVSTREQDLSSQDAELRAAGCAKVFREKASGAKTDRPELAKVIRRLTGQGPVGASGPTGPDWTALTDGVSARFPAGCWRACERWMRPRPAQG